MIFIIAAMAVLGLLFIVMALYGGGDRRPRQRDDQ